MLYINSALCLKGLWFWCFRKLSKLWGSFDN
jgi:hypothetical protein